MDYKDYLKTEHWKKTSSTKRKNLGSRCGICGIKKDLHVHHTKYYIKGKSVLFNEPRNILRILCKECHFMWHELRKDTVYKGRYGGRIKHLISLDYDKRFAFANCVGEKYKSAKKERKKPQLIG